MNKKTIIKLTALVVSLSFASLAFAGKDDAVATKLSDWNKAGGEKDKAMTLTPNRENGIEVYEVCAACHKLEGWGETSGTFPMLAGQHRNVLIKQLADIRALNRDNPTMYPFALPESIGDEQAIADVTAYISTLPMNPEPGVGPGTGLVAGEKLYKDNCVKCHGENGEGSNAMGIPLGAPNLADNIWLYSGSPRGVEQSIRHGRAGVMPAWKDILGEKKVHVISAYVYSLSQN